MIKANFNTYASYVTDSLYQWDLNQVLSVSGLNLAVVPEVHFSNAKMDRAIVRQATMVDHVVSVAIPNSLLQDPLRIHAHIGIYEGDTFKVVELVEIPVIARKRPSDYQIEDADEEIYSFKALENAIANMVTHREAEAISARIDTIVVNANKTEGNSELVDIRVDADGKIYESAGAAIRKQNNLLSEKIANVATKIGVNFLSPNWIEDKFITSYSTIENSTGYGYCEPFYVEKNSIIKVKATGFSNSVAIISRVNSDLTEIERVVRSIADFDGWYEYLVMSSGYFAVSANITKPVTIITEKNADILDLSTVCESALPYFDLSLFEKFGVVGDSFASGELYFNDEYVDNYNVSWGQILARKKGTVCTNYSAGGLSTRTWLTHSRGLSSLLSKPAEDIYYIALGINDYGKLGESYLGTINDITNYESYIDYSDTFYGNYGKIIEQIKNYAPNAKIILFTCANTDTVPALFNEAIIRIANHYSIPYIVQADDDFFRSDVYKTMSGGHPTAIGYAGMSCAFERLINRCVCENLSYFGDTYMY